jgi:hypothetical protein
MRNYSDEELQMEAQASETAALRLAALLNRDIEPRPGYAGGGFADLLAQNRARLRNGAGWAGEDLGVYRRRNAAHIWQDGGFANDGGPGGFLGLQFGLGGAGGAVVGNALEQAWRDAGAYRDEAPVKARKGFTRSFELEIGGYVDSSEDEEEEEEEDMRMKGSGGRGKGKEREVLSGPINLDNSDEEDDVAMVNDDGTTTTIKPQLLPLPPPVVHRRPPPQPKPRNPNRDPSFAFGCSSCSRPLILSSENPHRKIYSLACGRTYLSFFPSVSFERPV